MKSWLPVLLLCLPAALSARAAHLEKSVIDFGEVRMGQRYHSEVEYRALQGESPAILQVERAHTDSSRNYCEIVRLSKQPVLPQKSTVIQIHCQFNEAGYFSRSVSIRNLSVEGESGLASIRIQAQIMPSERANYLVSAPNMMFLDGTSIQNLNSELARVLKLSQAEYPRLSGHSKQKLFVNRGELEVSVVSEAKAGELFRFVADQSWIPYRAPEGCHSRATAIGRLLEKEGVIVTKSFLKANQAQGDTLRFVPKDQTQKRTKLLYHVAPMVLVRRLDGDEEFMILDPSLFDEPVTLRDWVIKQTPSVPIDHSVQLSITNRFIGVLADIGIDLEDYEAGQLKYDDMVLKSFLLEYPNESSVIN